MRNNKIISKEDFPITFNPYKHHLGFLRRQIEVWKKNDWKKAEQEIKLIGNNLIDIYFGRLTIDEILDEIHFYALKNDLASPEKLAHWLDPLEYRKTELSDKSFWVIKQGEDASRFLHIHPGKYSPFTIRVKATNLKTVIAVKILTGDDFLPDLNVVNKIRTERLKMSPIKGLVEGKGIARLLANFNSM
jgi:hypothetical protein